MFWEHSSCKNTSLWNAMEWNEVHLFAMAASCQGTLPAELLKYHFRYTLCLFPSILALGALGTWTTSCRTAWSRHAPGAIWPFPRSLLKFAFWRPGYHSLIRLWRQRQDITIATDLWTLCSIGVRRKRKWLTNKWNPFSDTLLALEVW